ncbi:LysM domain-containing protein [Halanaerobacter jeridensis]|uniref:LysM domain-containing protein n=1 Tax=Halanaerobacter jeridensis TaxID=706427 RepID=A0A938XVK2_9FIRM|nr:LysM domain-containing protein [Halanaerobacter jeridensis]MBM7556397.1 hypothetical protein [Halanaerobacter jeridensis]
MPEGETITHRELLTFSNLTNLEWEFVDIEAILNGKKIGKEGEKVESIQLKDLLIPEVFVRKETDPDTGDEREMPIYPEGEEGLIEMRKQAGIAMEYSEHTKEGEEGDFLKDWEVIYGGDKYKIVEDYLDKRWIYVMKEHLKPEDFKLSALGLTEKDFKTSRDYRNYDYEQEYKKYVELANMPEREDYEEFAKNKGKIEFVASLANPTIRLLAPWFDFTNGLSAGGQLTFLNRIANRIIYQLGTNDDYYSLSFGVLFFLNPFNLSSVLTGIDAEKEGDDYIELIGQELEKRMDDINNALKEQNEDGIKLTEKIDLYDEGRYDDDVEEFRVLVLKNDDNIVITCKGEQVDDKEILPPDFECLQIVYDKIKRQHPKAKITFTGWKGGAEISFIFSLFASQDKSYKVKKGDTLWDIADGLTGNSAEWGKLSDEAGNTFTEDAKENKRAATELQIGEEIVYCPAESEDVQGRLFCDNLKRLTEQMNFDFESINDLEYSSVFEFGCQGLNTGVNTAVYKAIYLIGEAIKNVLLIKSGKRLTYLGIKSLVTVGGATGGTLSFATMLTALETGLMALVIFIVFEGSEFAIDITEMLEMKELLIDELEFIKKNHKGIKNYVTDNCLGQYQVINKKAIEALTKEEIEVQILDDKYGIYASYMKMRRENSDLVLNWREDVGRKTIFLNTEGDVWIKFEKNNQGIYKAKSFIYHLGNVHRWIKLTNDVEYAFNLGDKDVIEWKIDEIISENELSEKLSKK